MINNKKKKNNKKKMSKKTGKPTAARRIRTKTRKPKFLSLISLELMSSEKAQETTETPPTDDDDVSKGQLQYLFPLHPENLVEENYYCNNNNNNKDSLHDENMAYLFSAAADGGGAASTLTGLLGSSAATATTTTSSSYNSGEEDDYYYKSQLALVRTALKNKERDSSEERYVRYSEVVERRRDEEVSSTAGAGADDVDDLRCGSNRINGNQKRLSLKLDYEEILNAWSDKGPLYVYAESPRTVPDIIHHQFLPHEFPIITNGAASDNGWRNHECSWRVPELTRNIAKVHHGIKEQKQHQQEQEQEPVVVVGEEEWKVGQREASVLRYKEKRQNRLFAKRIRYQVRKLNAEKRPRVKGRFVKRS